jgi:hypothetical protein
LPVGSIGRRRNAIFVVARKPKQFTLVDRARDLLETMRAAPGIWITAPHIGIM